mgnify:CR=1 FL=1
MIPEWRHEWNDNVHLNEEGKKILSKEDKLFVWGNKESKKASWKKMKENDLILFYKKGAFVYAGQLLFKQESKDLGLALWPPKKNEEPWTCIFFLKNLQPNLHLLKMLKVS